MALRKPLKIGLGILILLVAVRIALPYMIKEYVNKVINDLPGYKGQVSDIDLYLYRGAYTIENLQLQIVDTAQEFPFLEVQEIDLSVHWEALLKGALVGEILLKQPKLQFTAEADQDTAAEKAVEEKEHWSQTLQELMPLTINRFEVLDGSLAYSDPHAQPQVNMHIDSLYLTAFNLSNVEDSREELPSLLRLRGRTIGGGSVKLIMELNALKEIPDFDLDFQLINVDLTSLNNFLKAYGRFDVERGRFSLYSEVKMIDGSLKGYLKPFFEEVKVLNWKEEENNFLRTAWEAVVGLVTEGVENQPRDQLATQVPITGNVNQPETDVWTTVFNILKNAFVDAFEKGLEQSIDHQ